MSIRTSARSRQHATPKESFLGRLLDPIDVLSEAIFSVLIVLIYTLAFGAIVLGGEPYEPIPETFLSDLAIGVAGAVVAWGIIDGIMYALMSMFERGEHNRMLQQLRGVGSEEDAIQIVADEFDYLLESITSSDKRRLLYADALEHLRDGQREPVRLSREDIAGGLGSVIVAMIAVLPSLVPLLLFHNNPALAIRMSIVVSFVVLLVAGFLWGRHIGSNHWGFAVTLAGVSGIMVLIVFLLGG